MGGVLSLLGALTYGELGAMKPGAGGLYTYLRDAFGPVVAFLYGWTAFLVIASGSVATLALAGSAYVSQFGTLSPLGAKGFALLLIALVAVINVRGTRGSANVQNLSTGLKVAVLLVISGGLLLSGHGFSSGRSCYRPSKWSTGAVPRDDGDRDDRRALGLRRLAVRDLLGGGDGGRAARLPAGHWTGHCGADRDLSVRQSWLCGGTRARQVWPVRIA